MINFNAEKCTGCSVCLKVCPRHIIFLVNGKAQIKDNRDCLECGACMLNCGFDAIKVTKGTGCLYAIIKEDILKITPKGSGCGCGTGGSCC